jgi:DNA invertase Pin-like site-specific DNA recombinase
MEDRSKRGRTVRGAAHHSAKLTDEIAMEVYRLNGIKSMSDVANEFGISKQSVHRIWKKIIWKHIHEEVQDVTVPNLVSK